MNSLRPSLFALLVLAAALFGFFAARLAGSLFAPAGGGTADSRATAAVARKTSVAAPSARLPAMDFQDQAGFEARVAEMRKNGFPESLAKWLILSAKVRDDLPGSLAFAREARLLDQWGAAVALFHPEDGFELVSGVRNGLLFMEGPLNAYYSTLGRTDPALGLKNLRASSSLQRMYLSPSFFGSWARIDPDRAMDAVSQIESGMLRYSAFYGVFGEWGRRDPEGMMEWASDRGPEMARMAFRAQIPDFDRIDPEKLLALTREYPNLVDPWIPSRVAMRLSQRGTDGWALIAAYPAGRVRQGMISSFASMFARNDPKGAWELLKTLPPEDQRNFLDSSGFSLAEVAPEEVAKLALSTQGRSLNGLSEVVSAWSRKDPRAAVDWARQNLSGKNLIDSLESAFSGWGSKNPAEAAAAMEGFSPSIKSRLQQNLLGGWAGKDPRAALDYAQKLAPIDRSRSIDRVIGNWASQDPSAAAAALASLPPDGLDDAYRRVGDSFARKNPEQAIQWGASISDPKISSTVVQSASLQWAEKDAAAASAYADSLPVGELRDSAAAGLATALDNLDPESAAAWANAISTPKRRQDNLRSVLRTWKTMDRTAALKFVGELQPESLRAEMINLVNSK